MAVSEDYEIVSKDEESSCSSSSSSSSSEEESSIDETPTSAVATGKRSHLLILMGFPPEVGDSDYDPDEIEPDWEAVGEYLENSNTPDNNAQQDASIAEDGEYPLDDALWIQNYESGPVPAIVIVGLLRLCPQALTQFSLNAASENPTLTWDVRRLLASADVDSNFTQMRSELVQLMGYPPLAGDDNDDYDQEHVIPNWEAVRQHLISHPEEAALDEDGTYPLADALWIESKPVPLDVVILLMEACPESLTDEAFVYASRNEMLIGSNVLRCMFNYNNQLLKVKAKAKADKDRDNGMDDDEEKDKDMIILEAEPKTEAEDEIIVPPLEAVASSGDDDKDDDGKIEADVDVAVDSEVAVAVDVTDIPEWSKKQFLRYGDVVKIISNTGQACLDIGTDCFLRTTSCTESTPTTRLILDGPSASTSAVSHPRSGPIREGDVFGIYSEDRTLRLDIGKPSMKTLKNSLGFSSWATDLYLAPADANVDADVSGEKKVGQIINYGDVVGIFSSSSETGFRLNIGSEAVCEVAEASRDNWGTHLRVGFLGRTVER